MTAMTRDTIAAELDEHLRVLTRIREDPGLHDQIFHIAGEIIRCYRNGGKVLVFGCGGSAADSQHIAAEFINKLKFERACLPAIALTTDTSALTAIGNDSGFDLIFSRQVEGLAVRGDVVIGISTSGRSPSVINGLRAARLKGAATVFLTGDSVHCLSENPDYLINVPSTVTPRIQEVHITIAHIICGLVEEEMFRGIR